MIVCTLCLIKILCLPNPKHSCLKKLTLCTTRSILSAGTLWGKTFQFERQGAQQDAYLQPLVQILLRSGVHLRLGNVIKNEIRNIPFFFNVDQLQPLNQFPWLFMSKRSSKSCSLKLEPNFDTTPIIRFYIIYHQTRTVTIRNYSNRWIYPNFNHFLIVSLCNV